MHVDMPRVCNSASPAPGLQMRVDMPRVCTSGRDPNAGLHPCTQCSHPKIFNFGKKKLAAGQGLLRAEPHIYIH